MSDLRVEFAPPAKVWSSNERLHWAQVAIRRKAWREASGTYVGQILKGRRVRPGHYEVQVTLPFRDRRRRDPHNYTGTVVKAIVDGLVDAGVFPDDSSEYVTVMDSKFAIGGTPVVTIEVNRSS